MGSARPVVDRIFRDDRAGDDGPAAGAGPDAA
jgi:hypothetical protein